MLGFGLLFEGPHRLCPPRFGCRQGCVEDLRISTTAADVPTGGHLYVFECRIGIALDQSGATHDHAGSAEAALESIVLDEGCLHGMKLFAGGKTFDRRDLVRSRINRQGQARANWSLVEPHGTCAA